MRLTITLLLSFCLFLVKGYDHLYANTYQKSFGSSPKHASTVLLGGFTGVASKHTTVRKQTLPVSENGSITATDEVEDDDDKSFSAKKVIEISDYFLAFLHAQIVGQFHRYQKKRLPFCEHFSYTSSYKYIIQRVIKI